MQSSMGPKAIEILEAVTGESFAEMRFSRWRKVPILGVDTIVARQGVTGEVGYEFMMPTSAGKGHELWAAIRDAGREFGLRELGFEAQLVGHTETGIATVVRDFLPDRFPPASWKKFARLWTSQEELDALDWDIAEQLCSPAELGWKHTINLDHEFYGREALQREADAGGPARRLVGLIWNSDDMAELYARQFRDEPAPPPPDLPLRPVPTFIPKGHERRRSRRLGQWRDLQPNGASHDLNGPGVTRARSTRHRVVGALGRFLERTILPDPRRSDRSAVHQAAPKRRHHQIAGSHTRSSART
jgi:hypothetical protein